METMKDVVIEKLNRKLKNGQENAQTAITRLMDEGKIARDFLPTFGHVAKKRKDVYFTSFGDIEMKIGEKSFYFGDYVTEQIGLRIGVPPTFLKNLKNTDKWGRDLAVKIMNEHLEHIPKKKVLVRTVGNNVRAVLSNQYRRYDSMQIVNSFLENAIASGARVADAYMSDTKFWVDVLIPNPIDIPTPKNGVVTLAFGARLSTSDYGDGALEIRSYILQGVCLNGMVRESVMRQVHLGSRLPDNLELSNKTYMLDTQTQCSAIEDLTGQVLSRDKIQKSIDDIMRASSEEIDIVGELRSLAKRGVISKGENQEITEIFTRNKIDDGVQGDSTIWKLSQGITAYARDIENNRKLELEALAGSYLK